jgi:hypothetical protein
MMQILNTLEPIREILNPRTPFAFKRMRIFGRINGVKWRDFDGSWESQLPNLPAHISESISFNKEPRDIVAELRDQAYSASINLTPPALNSILRFCNATNFASRQDRDRRYAIEHSSPVQPADEYIYSIFDPHKDCSTIRAIAEEPLIRAIASAYLGCKARLLNTQVWYTFPQTDGKPNPEFGFHYDIDDYRFLKLFFYLSDVDADCGPHQIIAASHNMDPVYRFFNRRLTDQVSQRYASSIRSMEFPAGAGFFEDTFCYHRGTPARRPRLILQVQFSSHHGTEAS